MFSIYSQYTFSHGTQPRRGFRGLRGRATLCGRVRGKRRPRSQRNEGDAVLPLPTELALAETQDEAPAAKTSTKSKAMKGSKPKRPLNYNPNRAREQQRQELLYLREKDVEMEQELKTLQGTRRPKVEENNEEEEAVSSAEPAIGVLRVTRSAREAILLVFGYPHPPVPLYAI
ncbi:hypothetical protein PI124_g12235 [Phytophthora idaei]|nr:hypothetical protein PI124_g12235 [Phytophthora idaei]